MGDLFRNKDRNAVRQQAEAETRIATTQEELAKRSAGESDLDRAFREKLFNLIQPTATTMMSKPFSGIERPDLSPQIRRQTADELAGIQGDVNKGIAGSEDYFSSMGMGRSGARGMGFGSVVRGGDIARSTARRGMDTALNAEQLAKYEDTLARRGMDISAGTAGANILQGQQGMFDPYRSAGLAQTALQGATGTRGQAIGGFEAASRMPSPFSRVLGAAGGALGAISPMGGFYGVMPWQKSRPQPFQGGTYPGYNPATPG